MLVDYFTAEVMDICHYLLLLYASTGAWVAAKSQLEATTSAPREQAVVLRAEEDRSVQREILAHLVAGGEFCGGIVHLFHRFPHRVTAHRQETQVQYRENTHGLVPILRLHRIRREVWAQTTIS